MSLNNVSAGGFNLATAYMFPGIPWVTSSIVSTSIKHHHFNYVSSNVLVRNDGPTDLWLAFAENGFLTSNCLKIVNGESFSAEIRVADVYLSAANGVAYDLFAGLTLISRDEMPVLTSAVGSSPYWEGVG